MSYHPTLGRFIQRDPLGYVDGGSLYQYVANAPLSRVDPIGLQATVQHGGPTTQPTTRPDWSSIVPEEPDLPAPSYPDRNATRREREQFAHDLLMFYQQWTGKAGNNCCLPDACTLAAQWMWESGWGRNSFNQQSHNLGNIKGEGPAGSVEVPTWEVIRGKRIQVTDKFRKYGNLEQFFEDYNSLVCNNARCKNARGKSGREYFQALKDAGYATDPNYVENLMRIYRQIGC